ncbi:unnamed protein product [Eruca vesicaria subsp. sativa]|uniref:40S ribosomal protein S7 n=1 Tax=Eruca vesicaria subsp. sativa TaxID=29727 RepID=A0ABC8JAR3_ERUVS|nr:unnamed protein product [Eruca vesicaria subsp. sativa]
MFSAQNKIKKDKNAAPTECEEQVAQALFDLENTNQELKSELKDLYINQAVNMDWKPQGCCDLRPIQIEEIFPQDSSPSR